MIELILWDLDETLLPSEHLRTARHQSAPGDLRNIEGFTDTALHDGVARVMERSTEFRMGLVTSSPRWYVQQIVDFLLPEACFDVTVTYEDASKIKPDPEPLLVALHSAGTDPQRSVYIGDSHLDAQACVSAGVRFLGAGWSDEPTFPSGVEVLQHPLDIWTILEAS